MTVNYINKYGANHETALLFQWNGSFYKLIWMEMVVYLIFSYIMRIVRIYGLSDASREQFEVFCNFNYKLSRGLPIVFIVPFFVRLVINRRFAQYKSIPWIDKLGLYIATFMEGKTEYIKLTKRTIIRYCILSMALCFKSISIPSSKKFDNYDIFITNGLATEIELDILTESVFKFNNYFTPIIWATELLHRADRRGAIIGERCVILLLAEIADFHSKLQSIFFYDWINLPLVYTQVTTLCVYFYFVTALFGDQIIGSVLIQNIYKESNNITDSFNNTHGPELNFKMANFSGNLSQAKKNNLAVMSNYMNFIPFIEVLLFGLVMGWLKVAETMINPYGEDDEDFETNAIIERNLKIGYLMIENDNFESPNLTEDVIPIYLQQDQCNIDEFTLFGASQAYLGPNDKLKISHNSLAQRSPSQGVDQSYLSIDDIKLVHGDSKDTNIPGTRDHKKEMELKFKMVHLLKSSSSSQSKTLDNETMIMAFPKKLDKSVDKDDKFFDQI